VRVLLGILPAMTIDSRPCVHCCARDPAKLIFVFVTKMHRDSKEFIQRFERNELSTRLAHWRKSTKIVDQVLIVPPVLLIPAVAVAVVVVVVVVDNDAAGANFDAAGGTPPVETHWDRCPNRQLLLPLPQDLVVVVAAAVAAADVGQLRRQDRCCTSFGSSCRCFAAFARWRESIAADDSISYTVVGVAR